MPGMKICARLTPFVGLLVVSLMVTACGEGTRTVLPSSPSPTTSLAQSAAFPTNTTWTLQSLTETGSTEVTIADPSIFTLVLLDDGKVHARADCNRASAGYTVTDHTLSVGLMASTRAYCASAPIDGQYLALLGGENVVTISDAALQLSSSRGTLRFVR
jgi:heat shock protein HslJ